MPHDVAAITAMYNWYIAESDATFEIEQLSVEAMTQRIDSLSAYPYLVWEQGGTILGYAYAHPWKTRAAYARTYETTVYVAHGFHCRGIGRALMEALINECRDREVHALIACITGSNDASIALHATLGFKQVSLFSEVGEKFGRHLDVTDYELLL